MWTKEQEAAINKSGSNIIVSAGAGSGKTAVLTERVYQKVKSGIDIDKLLILTFTKAAAKEMKDRIKDNLKEDSKLKDQLKKIDIAYITTFDSFALSIVKKYHYLLNLSSNISIEQSGLVELKKIKLLDQIFENYYEKEDLEFIKFIYDFCIKDDQDIKNMLLSIYDKLDLKYDKISYLSSYIENYFQDKSIQLDIDSYINIIKNKINKIKNLLLSISTYIENDYYIKLEEILKPLINAKTYEEIKENSTIKLPPLPKNSLGNAKEIKEEITSTIKSIYELCNYENEEEIKNLILKTKDTIQIIIEILIKLDEELNLYKQKNNLYTFNDIAKLSIRLLKENQDICLELKQKFVEIMVDEYQDTSDIQEEFISLIENNNVYMVGDIKQSIYRFRNANPYIFKTKYDKYRNNDGGIKIDLTKNFRSREEVLTNINQIFENIMDDNFGGANYKLEHQMIYGNNKYKTSGLNNNNNFLEIYNYDMDEILDFKKEEVEIFAVAKDIQDKINNHYQVMDKKTSLLRDITWKDFVILMDKGTQFSLYKKVFEYLHIPLTVYRDDNIMSNINIIIIKNIIKLSILIKEHHEIDEEFKFLFLSIGRSYLFEYKDDYLFDCIKDKNYENDLIKKITILSSQIDNLSISSYIDKIIEIFNIYECMIHIGNMDENVVVLDYLKSIAKELEQKGYTIYDFENYLDELINNKLEMKFSFQNESVDSVKIMTIHASKGLEYPICYYTGLYSKFNIKELNEKILFQERFVVPIYNGYYRNTIYKELLKQNYIKEEISEKIRLFYVALTRAREKMIIITSMKENNLLQNKEKYRSFKDLLGSIKDVLEPFMVQINISSLNLTKDYNFMMKKELKLSNTVPLEVKEINIPNDIIEEKHFSKNKPHYITKEESNKLKIGTYLHEILEMIDFENPNLDNLDISTLYKNKIQTFLKSEIFNKKILKIYKEFEFEYMEDKSYHGIIDLMLEYEDEIKIIDYKLKNILDDEYLNQLNGYKKYISKLTDKKVNTYLYSILDETIQLL